MFAMFFEYDDSWGNSPTGIKPGTKPEDFPDEWKCPICASDKSHLKPVKKEERIAQIDETMTCPHCGAKSKVTISTAKMDLGGYLAEWKRDRDDLKKKVDWLREKSDGRPGATGASPKFVKQATSVPTVFALYRAKKYLDKNGIKDISLIITGGLRVSTDFIKALALGADAVAIGTAALIACACQQYRLCDTGKCPVGVTTHNPELRERLKVEFSAKKLENFLRVSTEELKDFARLTGNDDVHKLSIKDLCTTNSEISNHTEITHV